MSDELQDYLEQAYAYEEAGNLKAALAACAAAISHDPQSALAYNFRGIVLEDLGLRVKALAAYKQAQQLDPDFTDAADNFHELKAELLNDELVILEVFSHPNEAYLLKARLESEGLWVFLANENFINMNWFLSNTVGGVKLLIKGTDTERAAEILYQEMAEEDWDEESLDEFDEIEAL